MHSGTMSNDANEGHAGKEIAEVESAASSFLTKNGCPDLMLLHIGTNDCMDDDTKINAPSRVGTLLDNISTTCPDMVAIVALIIGSLWAPTTSNIAEFDTQVRSVVQQRVQDKGRKYLVVDMLPLLDSDDDYSDIIHPNDTGYEKMAGAWFSSVLESKALGWLGII